MILDDDANIIDKNSGTKLNHMLIETVFRKSYEESTDHDAYSSVTGRFRIVIRDLDVNEIVSVSFYRYEYERMLNEEKVYAGYVNGEALTESKIVWKTINNFIMKLRRLGHNVDYLRYLKFELYPA